MRNAAYVRQLPQVNKWSTNAILHYDFNCKLTNLLSSVLTKTLAAKFQFFFD